MRFLSSWISSCWEHCSVSEALKVKSHVPVYRVGSPSAGLSFTVSLSVCPGLGVCVQRSLILSPMDCGKLHVKLEKL